MISVGVLCSCVRAPSVGVFTAVTLTADVEATFGFVDLAGFTALTEAHGDRAAVSLLDRFEEIARACLGDDDRIVKMIGDAAMLAFADPAAAVTATTALYAAALGEPGFPVPRAGLHHGSAVERDGDYIGAAVNLAARVAAQAHGGQVLATRRVAAAARDLGVAVTDLGPFVLRNVADSVDLFSLDVADATEQRSVDPVCRMQVAREDAAGRLRYGDRLYWFCSLECAAAFAANPAVHVGGESPSPT